MRKRRCTCGAEAHERTRTQRTTDGREEPVCEVCCPICGQLDPGRKNVKP